MQVDQRQYAGNPGAAPQGNQYAPQGTQYAPQGTQYAPQSNQYAPQNNQYAPQNNQYAPQSNQYAPQNNQYASNNQYQGAPQPQYTPSAAQYAPAMAHPPAQYPQSAQQWDNKYAQAPPQQFSQAGAPPQQFSQAGAPPQQYPQQPQWDKYAQPPQQFSQAGAPPQQFSQAGAPPQPYSQTPQHSQPGPNQYAPAPQHAQAPATQSGVGGTFSSLQSVPHITIHQKIERMEIFSGWETANRYVVVGPRNESLFFCGEKSNVMGRMFLKADRPMDINVMDSNQRIVMRINRPFKLWKKNVMIEDGQGGLIGHIRKKFAITKKQFFMEDSSGRVLYTIEGPPVLPWKFKILDPAGNEVGQILKKWTGLAQELFSDADSFTCFFPADASAHARAMFMAATLFIDLTYFEN